MGVTIQFEGQLSSPKEFHKVIETTKRIAEAHGLEYFLFQEENKLLQRVKDEQDWHYEGPTKGIQIQPNENSHLTTGAGLPTISVRNLSLNNFADDCK